MDTYWGGEEMLASMSYYLGGRRHKKRSAEDIQLEIAKVKQEAGERVDAAWLDRRAYCLTNVLVNIEREIPVMELHIKSMDDMPEELKKTTDWNLDRCYIENRLKTYRTLLDEGAVELEDIKAQLKLYNAKKETAELEEELKELDDVEIEDKTEEPKKDE